MRIGHFESLKPICPNCVDRSRSFESPLQINRVENEEGGHIVEGILRCSNLECQSEFPVVDGIPILLPRLRSYVAENIFHIIARQDFSASTESLLGDCCSQGSALDTMRQHLSCYTWDHYAEFDPCEPHRSDGIQPGSVVRILEWGLNQPDSQSIPKAPMLDIGCGVGRTTFELASRTKELVLGIDLHFAMLRLAAKVLRKGRVSYPRRRVGLVYDRREFQVPFNDCENVDFWACDILSLPFSNGTFSQTIGMNVLDAVASPYDFLISMANALGERGIGFLACPYDWSTAATSVEAWIGGHSQRGEFLGESSLQLRKLFRSKEDRSKEEVPNRLPLEILGEADRFPWSLRLHDRSSMLYEVDLIRFQRGSQ